MITLGLGLTTAMRPRLAPRATDIFTRSGQTFALGSYQGDSGGSDANALPNLRTWLGAPVDIASFHLAHADCRYSYTRSNLAGFTAPSNVTTMHWSFPPITKPAVGDSSDVTPTLALALAGAYDADWIALGQMMAAKSPPGPAIVRPAWEFQIPGAWAWSSTTQAEMETLAAVSRRVVTVLRGVSNRFLFEWCPNAPVGGVADIEYAYPGDAYVDIIGMDVYFEADNAGFFGYIRDHARGLIWQRDFAAAHGKRLSFPEFGHQGNTANGVAGVHDMAAWARTYALYSSYWNSSAAYPGLVSDGADAARAAAFMAEYGTPVISTSSTVTTYTGEAISIPLVASHPGVWSIVGSAGPWLISGSNLVAASQSAGSYSVTVRVTDGRGLTADLAMTITVAALPTIATTGNLLTNAEALDNAYWTKSGATVTANVSAGLNPASNTADRIIEAAGDSFHRALRAYTTTTSAVYRGFAVVANFGARYVNLSLSQGRVTFDLQTGTVVGSGSTSGHPTVTNAAIAYRGAGRWLIQADFTEPAGASREFKLDLNRVNSTTNDSPFYTGDGTSGVDVSGLWMVAV